MSSWWNKNKRYVKAYVLYVLIIFMLQLVVKFLHVHMYVTRLFHSFGITQKAGFNITLLFLWIVFVWLGFIVFRAVSKKFIVSESKRNNETQNQ